MPKGHVESASMNLAWIRTTLYYAGRAWIVNMSVVEEELILLCVVKIQVKALETVCHRNGMANTRLVVARPLSSF